MIESVQSRCEKLHAYLKENPNCIVMHNGYDCRLAAIFTSDGCIRDMIRVVADHSFGLWHKEFTMVDYEGVEFAGSRMLYYAKGHLNRSSTELVCTLYVSDRKHSRCEFGRKLSLKHWCLERNLGVVWADDYRVGDKYTTELLGALKDYGFKTIEESEIYEVDRWGSCVVAPKIVQNATGHYITHATCSCGNSLGCMYFDMMSEAEAYRDEVKIGSCRECQENVWKSERKCETCLNHFDECPYGEQPSEKCDLYEYDSEWDADDYDEWCPEGYCACPIGGNE